MTKFGIDVSKHQGTINWKKVKSQIDFAILRLGWIGNKNNHVLDEQFERNYTECKRLGIPIGCYVYNYCNKEETAKDAGDWVIEQLNGKSLELPIYIDMEEDEIQNLGKDKLMNIINEFCSIIETAGFWAGVYANKNWYDNYLNKEEIKKRYTTWIAHYTRETNKYENEYDMWQNSSDGKIDGISGSVDTNYLYRDLINDIKNSNSINTKSVEELANEVIEGKWGNGDERKQKLTGSGYNYDEVQAKVNEILKNKTTYYTKCDFYQSSLVDALKSISVDSSYENRKKIAAKNGISNYLGTYEQNMTLLNLLKNGKLIKV